MTKHKTKSVMSSPTKGKGGGKGKGEAGGKQSHIDLKDCPLDLKEFASMDFASVPRFASILRRNESDGVGLEDIDSLQQELEALLSTVVVRKRHIVEEMELLQNIDKYKGKNKKSGPSSPGKRSGGKEGSTVKKMKLNSGKPADSGKLMVGPKMKNEPSTSHFDPLQNEQIKPLADNKPTLPKNETPNRFWAFVEPYCAPIQQEDIKFLEDLIKSYGDLGEYFRVPPIGQHFAIRWAKEDMEAERTKGAEDKDAREDGGKLIKKADVKSDGSPFGELTQRLVQGLMEENLMTSVDDSLERGRDEDCGTKASFIQSLKVTNGDSLERRLKKELEEQGILDPNDTDQDSSPEDDEILAELQRCQAELKAVSQHNLSQLKRLVKSAKEEMARQEIRSRLAEADSEVCEAYKKIALARSKKKSPSKKEREAAWKALKEREIILKQLEQV